ncbi:hypothetical protein OGAPHI_002223 [Ogataea philodendri]|uniref:Uncharacterized protein n=1 Tax=Ogataea philodendri TaxID=1378263 RepID=A0A9P8PBK5_9ASCO|nr:uncharacterized protein OGAPHI_002223 [Ogataea philodendri]KAH3668469.1 hypothetical protein OGAPHI_002223 [Ogataea philodendri]
MRRIHLPLVEQELFKMQYGCTVALFNHQPEYLDVSVCLKVPCEIGVDSQVNSHHVCGDWEHFGINKQVWEPSNQSVKNRPHFGVVNQISQLSSTHIAQSLY